MKRSITKVIIAVAILTAAVVYAQEHDHKGCDHDHGEKEAAKTEERKAPADEAKKLTIKDVGVIVLVHNEKEGKISLTVVDTKEGALKPNKAPRLNLMVDGKRKQVKTAACEKTEAGNVFLAEDAVLKGKLSGQIAIKIGEKYHKVNLADVGCDQDHSHEGHNH